MNDVREGAVCGVDGCSTPDIPSSTGAERAARQTLSLEVISDAICPWCWVAKHRLDRAIAALGPETAVEVTWRPFELNPDMPKDGLDRRAYRSHKFGSWERSQALDGQVAEAARSDGLVFRHELIGRTPNTRDAHRLIWLAGREGVQGAVVEALFSAYFHDGRDVGEGQGAHPIDTQGVDRIRCQRQRQKLIGFLLVAVEKVGVPGTSHGLRDFE